MVSCRIWCIWLLLLEIVDVDHVIRLVMLYNNRYSCRHRVYYKYDLCSARVTQTKHGTSSKSKNCWTTTQTISIQVNSYTIYPGTSIIYTEYGPLIIKLQLLDTRANIREWATEFWKEWLIILVGVIIPTCFITTTVFANIPSSLWQYSKKSFKFQTFLTSS